MKVVLLGDSIRQQYAGAVKELLGGDFEVWAPDDNCRFAKYTLRGLFDWASGMEGADIVHWNNGLWDLCNLFGDGNFTSESEYIENILRIADVLQKRHRAVIFATTTPVRAANIYNKNVDADRFNSLVVPLLKERGVIINDLNALLRDDPERFICNDTIHLSEEAVSICAEQVAGVIRDTANAIKAERDSRELPTATAVDGMGAPILFE